MPFQGKPIGEKAVIHPDLLQPLPSISNHHQTKPPLHLQKGICVDLICGLILVFLSGCCLVKAEDPYKYFTWVVTYGTAAPLNVSQQVILINGQFPGPQIDTVTNDNIVINVINNLDQPFLLTWNGIKQRKNSWQDGVLGTNCPIPPNSNYTYKLQTNDQIGTYTLHDFIEIVRNDEDNLQSWHLNGHDFWVVGYGSGQWSNDSR
ncbi:L-ascorbate oxidase homolog [Impatiens glandulifera]|uniref:L-ascorbate oxidase homolog n=1 Tax=Impatiens glandulifera TaxID=253017 RepID=UPI001FB0D771|nr:L-ascorbate oxidase homolog [Impatiens glandulifera]